MEQNMYTFVKKREGIPSVTKICCQHINTDYIPESAAVRGTRVHEWVSNYLNNIWDPIEKEYSGYTTRIKRWLDVNKAEITAGEIELHHYILPYFGHPDFIGKIKGKKGYGIIDFKTSKRKQPWWVVQLAGYYGLVNSNIGALGLKEIEWCAHVRINEETDVVAEFYDFEEIAYKHFIKFKNLLGVYCTSRNIEMHQKSVDKFVKEFNTVVTDIGSEDKVIRNYISWSTGHKRSFFNNITKGQ